MIEHGTPTIPEPAEVGATSLAAVDEAVARVAGRRRTWAETTIEERIALVEALREAHHEVAAAWAEATNDAKGIPEDSPLRGEGWITGPMTALRHLRLLQETLEAIRDRGAPEVAFHTRDDGQVVAEVFPAGPLDNLLYPRMTGEVWLEPGVTLAEARSGLARQYGPGRDEGGLCLVLGAGNVSSIPVMDVLTKLFNDNRVVVLKLNPVNDHLLPQFEQALAPLVEEGFLAIVTGGREVGEHLTAHEDVDEIHMTGSDRTFDAIVWGPGEEGEQAKREGRRRTTKPVTAELGNVSPVIVVPGPWSAGDVSFQGDAIASMLVHNAGFNCIAARVVVTHGKWARRRDLLDAVRDSLERAEERVPYYPGAVDRWRSFVEAHPQAEVLGRTGEDRVPFTLIPEVPEDDTDARAFTTEAFCGVISETALDAPLSIPAYLRRAVEFCNDTLWGTLGATIVVHPRSMKDPAVATAVEQAIADLRYGAVAVNTWTAAAYGWITTTWGAYPGATDEDIQSGRGVVHNSLMLDHVQKTVVRAPFRSPIKPPTFHTHRTLHEVGPRVTELEATGDLSTVPSLLWHAMRG